MIITRAERDDIPILECLQNSRIPFLIEIGIFFRLRMAQPPITATPAAKNTAFHIKPAMVDTSGSSFSHWASDLNEPGSGLISGVLVGPFLGMAEFALVAAAPGVGPALCVNGAAGGVFLATAAGHPHDVFQGLELHWQRAVYLVAGAQLVVHVVTPGVHPPLHHCCSVVEACCHRAHVF
jgi:hypothetical protein